MGPAARAWAPPRWRARSRRAISVALAAVCGPQDRLGKQATRVHASGNQQIWRRDLSDGSVAAVALNTGHFAGPETITIAFSAIGIQYAAAGVPMMRGGRRRLATNSRSPALARAARARSANARVRDLIGHKDLGTLSGSIVVDVNPVSVAMFKVTPV